MGSSVDKVQAMVEESTLRGVAIGEELARKVLDAGVPPPTDHTVMAFMYGFMMQFTKVLHQGGVRAPDAQMWLGYALMSIKTLQIAVRAYEEAGADASKFQQVVEQATREFMEQYAAAPSKG